MLHRHKTQYLWEDDVCTPDRWFSGQQARPFRIKLYVKLVYVSVTGYRFMEVPPE